MSSHVLVINAGSSSIKFSAFALEGGDLRLALKGLLEGIGSAPQLSARRADGSPVVERHWPLAELPDHNAALAELLALLREQLHGARLLGVGHRVVHGGARYSAPVLLDAQVMQQLDGFIPLAPLHQPHNLAAIRALQHADPSLPQVACFDTAFHQQQSRIARLFALPRDYYERGVRRYGFHGLSYEYIAGALRERAPALAAGRVVVAHLGSGASMCALRDGHSVASTMGFSALDGLVMGTRTGQLDPGVLLYLMQHDGMDARQLEQLLYRQSGLLGLSGISNDMRTLLASDAPEAAEAIDCFVYRVQRELGSLAAALGGLDALVFTAGIGERSAEIRARICAGARWLGLELDAAANAATAPCISAAGSAVSAWVIPTDEELMIARHTLSVLGG